MGNVAGEQGLALQQHFSYKPLACENSRPSSLPARVAFREKDTSFSRNATQAGSEEGRLFSQANKPPYFFKNSDCHKISSFNHGGLKFGHFDILDMLFPFLAFVKL